MWLSKQDLASRVRALGCQGSGLRAASWARVEQPKDRAPKLHLRIYINELNSAAQIRESKQALAMRECLPLPGSAQATKSHVQRVQPRQSFAHLYSLPKGAK